MAKPHAGVSTQRPSSARSAAAAASARTPTLPTPTSIPRADLSSSRAKASTNRSSVGSSSPASATDLPAPAAGDIAKEVAKFLSYDDGSDFPTAASKLQPVLAPEGLADLQPLLVLPDPEPEDTASPTVVSACPADPVTASADSTATQPLDRVPIATDTDAPLLTEIEHVLAELGGARGLSPRSKRFLAALVEVANAELKSIALRMRRTAIWRKVRIGILAATVLSVAAMDIALAVALFGAHRWNGRYHHVLPPT